MELENQTATVDFYWRPGCGFCAMLERGLRKKNIAFNKKNIWENPDASAFVRAAAGGNETVPTISVAGKTMVNPSVREVVSLLDEIAPGAVS